MNRYGQSAPRLALVAALLLVASWHTGQVFDLGRKDYGEGPILAHVERWRNEPAGPAWLSGPPWTVSPYAPGYYWAVRALSPLTAWDHTLIPGRLISLAALLATALVLAAVAYRRTRSLEIGLAAALFYVAAPVVTGWSPFHRVDHLAIFFAASAYAVLRKHPRSAALSGVLIVAGSLVKQTIALTAGPVVLYLLLTGRYRSAAVHAGVVVVLGLAVWGLLGWLSGGYLLTGAIHGNLNPLSWHTAYQVGRVYFTSPVAVLAFAVLAYHLVTAPRQLLTTVYPIALTLNVLLSAALSSKEGAWINYYLEATFLAVLVVVLYGLAPLAALHRARLGIVLLALAIVLPLSAAHFRVRRQHQVMAYPAALLDRLRGGECLADGGLVDVVVAAGRQPLVNDPYLFRQLVDNGTLDPAPLVEALAAGRLETLVLSMPIEAHRARPKRSSHWPPAVLDAMDRYYVPVDSYPGCVVYGRRGG